MDESDPEVRHLAILAMGGIDLYLNKSRTRKLGDDFWHKLITLYEQGSTAPRVRIEVMKTFAVVSDNTRDRLASRLLTPALEDPEPGVLQYAALLVAEVRASHLLPAVTGLLDAGQRGVRTSAAQTLARFGAQSAPYLDRLERAAASESDAATRMTMTAAIDAIRKAKG